MKRVSYRKWLSLVLCTLLLSVLLISCAKGENNAAMDVPSMDHVEEMAPSISGGAVDKSEIGDSLQGESTANPEEGLELKIIKTAEIYSETKQFDTALTKLEETVKALGGYVESSSVRGQSYGQTGGNRYAEYTVRIPAEKLDEFLTTAGTLVHVTSSSTSATDVSGEYYDIEARLSVLETERQVLEDMLSKTTSVSNMIDIEQRLYEVIYEIESYKTMLKVYDSKVAYSTVKMTVNEVEDLTVVNENNTFGSRLKTAITESWQNFVDFCEDFVIVLIYALPTLVVLGVIALVFVAVVLIVVKVSLKKAKKRKKQSEENS